MSHPMDYKTAMRWLETGHSNLHARIKKACMMAAALKPEPAGQNSLLDFKQTVCFHVTSLQGHLDNLRTEEENEVRKALEVIVELFIRVVNNVLYAWQLLEAKDKESKENEGQ